MLHGLAIYQHKAWEELTRIYAVAPASLISTPGRDLSQEEARDIVMHLVVTRQIQLIDPPLFGAKGVQIPSPGKRYKISNQVAGVTYKAQRVDWDYLKNVDLAWIVVLYRLACGLRDQFRAYTIYWGGIGVGADDKPKADCHHTGRAMDFFGADTRLGAFRVAKDWSAEPIVVNQKTVDDWPASQVPHYRLSPNINRGYYFFEWMYSFATRECQDYSTGRSVPGKGPSKIGDHGFVIHPDHPTRNLRRTHQDHMHFQVGPT